MCAGGKVYEIPKTLKPARRTLNTDQHKSSFSKRALRQNSKWLVEEELEEHQPPTSHFLRAVRNGRSKPPRTSKPYTLANLSYTVPVPPPLPPVRPLVPDRRALALELRLAGLGAAQRARNRGGHVPGAAAEPADGVAQRERARAHRAERQQRAAQHPHQTGGRDREHPRAQVHAVPDAEGRGFFYTEEEADQSEFFRLHCLEAVAVDALSWIGGGA